MSLTAGEKYIEHMRHHLADYKNLQPLLATPPAASPTQPLHTAADKAVRVRRFRKRRLKPAHVKKEEEEEEEEERGGLASAYGSGHAVSDDDCLGDSELSDTDSDSCQQQTEKVGQAHLI
jgi:hypothetical protein